MANPTVEKLKEVGLRYGDKAAVALTSLLFVVCLGAALSKKSIEMTPERSRRRPRRPRPTSIAARSPTTSSRCSKAEGIKPTNFAKEAEEAAKTLLVADNYKPDREWVTPEPGAGLIRDTPELIAPTELYAYPGRGGALVYRPRRERQPESRHGEEGSPQGAAQADDGGRRSRCRRHGRRWGWPWAARRPQGGSRKSQAELEKEQRKRSSSKKRELAAKLAGSDKAPDAKADEAKEKAAGRRQQQQFKEITKGLRWVAITGVTRPRQAGGQLPRGPQEPAVGHPALRAARPRAPGPPEGRLLVGVGDVDADENLKVLDNLPEEDEELTPENVRPDNLNDPLPFLKSGLWEKVHIASLVPKEKKEVAKPPPAMGGMMGGGMGGMMQAA